MDMPTGTTASDAADFLPRWAILSTVMKTGFRERFPTESKKFLRLPAPYFWEWTLPQSCG
jgi:hypothetical protein